MSRRNNSGTRIFIGNLPRDIREREIEDIFYKYGRIREIQIRSSKNRGPSFAFVDFEDARDAEDAIKGRDRYNFDGFRIRVEASNSQGEYKSRSRLSPTQSRRNPPKRSLYRIYVSNLPDQTSWQDLKDHMRQAGEVLFADVYKDRTAVVEFARYEDMKSAMNTLQGSTFRSHEESAELTLREDKNSHSRSRSSSHSKSNRKSRSRSRSRTRSHSSHESLDKSGSRSRSRSR